MKPARLIAVITASFLAISLLSAYSGQGKGGGSAKHVQQHEQKHSQTHHTDMRGERSQAQDQAQQGRGDTPDDAEIYGSELMSSEERNRYREQLNMQSSDTERKQFRQEHEKAMQQRARDQGKDLVPPGQGEVYGGELMTVQERNAYREQLRHIESEQEREEFEARHREKMNERAMALNLEVDESR